VNQVLGVVRLQLLNVRLGIGVPLVVFAAVAVLNVALFAAIGPVTHPEDIYPSAMLTLYLAIGAGYIQTTSQTFRFALGLGVTRRAFAAAVVVLALVDAAAYGALLGLVRLVELATDGWGLQLSFFGLDQLGPDAGPLLHWLVYAAPFVVLAATGALVGAVHSRWGTPGIFGLVVVVLAALAGGALLIAAVDGWPAVTGWLAAQPPLAMSTGYPLVLALLLGAGGWLAIRRATP
jgi:hypothetical protein